MKHPYLYQPIDNQPRVKVLVDADVLLELFINRSGFVEDVERLLTEIKKSPQIEVYTTDKCLKRIRIEDELGDDAVSFVEEILCGRVITIDSEIRVQARVSCLQDYDSAEELACANARKLDAIITQNPQNFDGSTLPIWSVANFLERVSLEKNRHLRQLISNPDCVKVLGSFLEIDCVKVLGSFLEMSNSSAIMLYFSGHGNTKPKLLASNPDFSPRF